MPFVLRARGPAATGRAVLALALPLLLGLTADRRRDAGKELFLARLLAGRELASLQPVAEVYADDVVASRLRPDTCR